MKVLCFRRISFNFDTQKPRKNLEKKIAKLQIRSPKHWPIGFFAGLSYINMVAAWGGDLVWMDLLWPGMAREQVVKWI